MQKHVEPFLADISDKLWSNHATVLVGAGFSKNAKPTNPTCIDFPSWEQLGDIFYKKIHCNSVEGKFLNVLKLADEVEAAFGRSNLEQILINNIPDKDYEPSDLHVKLLDLPWGDVFTTNYDTLLERACVSVISYKYDVVLNKDDLVNAERPRIIKLHGSFPSERPFIITEEDYRCYPSDFSVFVNTVQQSLIENTLCLIGFSGDDPNFLKWIGWIRDNLGQRNSPKIYLIGVFSFSNAQSKLLDKRNVTVINLAECQGVDNDHYKGMEFFIDYLMKGKVKRDNLSWPRGGLISYFPHRLSEEVNLEKIRGVVAAWKDSRLNYPGWCVLPEENRSSLWSSTNNCTGLLSSNIELDTSLEFNFIYEFTWRIERCLLPLINNLDERVEGLVDREFYLLSDEKRFYLEDRDSSLYEEQRKLIFLSLMLLAFYRQEDKKDKWKLLSDKLYGYYDKFSSEEKAQFNYEKSLFSLFKLDFSELAMSLSNWERNESLPFYEAKRAGLMAELGQIDEAVAIVEKSLNTIRKRLSLKPISNNYTNVSQEAYVMLLIRYFNTALRSKKDIYEDGETISNFSERWNQLAQYKTDPWGEIKIFEIRLERDNSSTNKNGTKKSFDIGVSTTTHDFGTFDVDVLTSLNFLLFCESAGICFKIPHSTIASKTAAAAAKRIYKFSPYWAMATIFRVGNKKYVENIINRIAINNISVSEVDDAIQMYMDIFNSTVIELDLDVKNDDHMISSGLIEVIPEIISRYVVKSSLDKKLKTIDLLEKLYMLEDRPVFLGVKNLTHRVINSLSNQEKLNAIPKLIKFSSVNFCSRYPIGDFYNPIVELRRLNFNNVSRKSLNIDKAVINNNLMMLSSDSEGERKWASTTLIFLSENALLNANEKKKLVKALWSKQCEYGFPLHTDYYKFFFINELHPENIDVKNRFISFISACHFPIQKNKEKKGVSITRGNETFCNEVIHGLKLIHLGKEHVESTLEKLIIWFESDKGYLHDKSTDIVKEMLLKLDNIPRVATSLLCSNIDAFSNESLDKLFALTKNMKNAGCMTLELECALLFSDEKKHGYLLQNTEGNLTSNDDRKILDALKAINYLVMKNDASNLTDFIRLLADKIKWKEETYFQFAIDIISYIYEKNSIGVSEYLNEAAFSLLNNVASQQVNNVFSDEDEFIKWFERRVHVASLACSMYNYFPDKNIPSIIFWKNVCNSANEFDEIKNAWR
ncbi:Uncharacterised protein [Serratia fonticola]|uniref:SIR2 family NAD-dependent protein deacylase n=1 Tax=Serratia fonticola TaxID=47917 RepID=UPI00218276B7|nr:SIR2 family protein [Serratia fonticola]CAI2103897.1 Uncharacterised protein [Serratia fonticola]